MVPVEFGRRCEAGSLVNSAIDVLLGGGGGHEIERYSLFRLYREKTFQFLSVNIPRCWKYCEHR